MDDLTFVRKCLDYNPDTGAFTWKVKPCPRMSVGAPAGSAPDRKGYTNVRVNGRLQKCHRVAWLYVYGEWPKLQVDHINGVRNDNRISNLRLADAFQNQANSIAKGSSGKKGAHYIARLGKWQAEIRSRGVRVYLGVFDTPEGANAAYAKAAIELNGEFARY